MGVGGKLTCFFFLLLLLLFFGGGSLPCTPSIPDRGVAKGEVGEEGRGMRLVFFSMSTWLIEAFDSSYGKTLNHAIGTRLHS